MTTLDDLPGDQRAVLQLVLGRGRSYGEIARLLSIDPEAVRARALDALDALGPDTSLPADRRGPITDYLLGQLDEGQAQEVRGWLGESAADRAWAKELLTDLTPLASNPLPEIPAEPASQPTVIAPVPEAPGAQGAEAEGGTEAPPVPAAWRDARSGDVPDGWAAPPDQEAAESKAPKKQRQSILLRLRGRGAKPADGDAPPTEDKPGKSKSAAARVAAASAGGPEDATTDQPRSSKLGGVIVIIAAVAVVAVVLVLLLRSGNSSNPTPAASAGTHTKTTPASTPQTTTTQASTPAQTGTTTAASTSTGAKILAQINMTPPNGSSKAAGIAEVLGEGTTNGLAIVAQNIPPNTTHPPNAYAVWLYNSPTDAHILGFVNPGVGPSGRLSAASPLPSNASHYKHLILTLETMAKPKTPGPIVLEGTLAGI